MMDSRCPLLPRSARLSRFLRPYGTCRYPWTPASCRSRYTRCVLLPFPLASRFRNPEVTTDLAGQKVIDLAMPRDGRGLSRAAVHIDGVMPTFPEQLTAMRL